LGIHCSAARRFHKVKIAYLVLVGAGVDGGLSSGADWRIRRDQRGIEEWILVTEIEGSGSSLFDVKPGQRAVVIVSSV